MFYVFSAYFLLFLQYWTLDPDYNRVPDQLTFEFIVSSSPLTDIDLYLGLESHLLTESSYCNFHIPSAVIIPRLSLPKMAKRHTSDDGRHLIIAGRLILQQKSAFQCPFFLREKKSHFYTELLPANSTSLRDFEMRNIQKRLRSNVGYLEMEITDIYWATDNSEEDYTGKSRPSSPNQRVSVYVDVVEVPVRYRTTVWQLVNLIWVYYMSVLLVFIVVVNWIKDWMFKRQIICAWQIIPWKKLY